MAEAQAEAGPRILVRGVNWLGDAVMTMPAVQRLRQRFPRAHIALVAPNKLTDLWALQPAVDHIIPFPPGETLLSLSRRIREHRADLAVVLPNSTRSALEVFFAGIPVRAGFAGAWRTFLFTKPVAREGETVRMQKRSRSEVMRLLARNAPRQTWPASAHQIHHYLRLTAVFGADPQPIAPALSISSQEVRAAAEKFGLTGGLPGARPLLGLNPGAEYGPAKRWPPEHFVQTAVNLSRRLDCVWLILGGTADAPLAMRIKAGIEESRGAAVNVAGKTSLRELCALLRLCGALLTNDTGPMHLAAALGTPVVATFGSTAPELTGPGLPGDTRHKLLLGQVPCAPCFLRQCPIDLRCLKQIPPDQATSALISALSPLMG